MKISIIGAGNGGQAMAGHFALLGHEIILYNRNLNKLKPILKKSEIHLSEKINGIGKIKKITNDIKCAIKNSELIMIVTTANAHKELAIKIAPYVKENQIFVLNPGRTLGAMEFSKNLYSICKKRVYIAEAQSLIYACRIIKQGEVRIVGVKDNVLLSAYPKEDTKYVIEKLNNIFKCFKIAKNILETSLENIGAILHPPVIIFNANTIERGELLYFYNDISPTLVDFIMELDKERLKIGKAFGLNLLSVSDWISFAYNNIKGDTFYEKIKNNPAYYKILAPKTLKSRLLLEDVSTGILPLIDLGKLANLQTPIMNSILKISDILLGIDFRKNGRTLKSMNLQKLNIKELNDIL